MTVFYFILGGSYPLKFTQLTFGKERGQCQKKTKMTVSRSQEARLEVLDSCQCQMVDMVGYPPRSPP